MGVCLTVFWAIRTFLRIGRNTSSCLSFTPSAARLVHGEKCRVVCVVDSFIVMVLLSLDSVPSIGMTHHPSFGKSLSGGSTLPLLWAKFRKVTTVSEVLSPTVVYATLLEMIREVTSPARRSFVRVTRQSTAPLPGRTANISRRSLA